MCEHAFVYEHVLCKHVLAYEHIPACKNKHVIMFLCASIYM